MLTSTLSNLFTYLLNRKVCLRSEEYNILSEAQFAFEPGVATVHAIYVLNSVLRYVLMSSSVLCAFIDFSKAFGNVERYIVQQIDRL